MQSHVIKILEPKIAESFRLRLEDLDWQVGQARTAQLTGDIKKNKELKPQESQEIMTISKELCNLVGSNLEVSRATQMKQMMLFKFNNYDEPDGAYHRHTDAPWMGNVRTDFTAVLALTDPDQYTGGDHHVVDPLEGEIILRPKAGEMVLYETGYPHWVDPVNKGARISALSWIESRIPDSRKRGLCATLRGLSAEFEKGMYDEDYSEEQRAEFRRWFVDTGVVHSGLYRMWASSPGGK
jgi:predicted 2-oxoglutarate/Fe(II)-dependent dioxygenase YbiX